MGTFRNWPPPSDKIFKRTGKPTFKKPKKPKGGGGGGITDPTDLTGLVLWLDGSDSSTIMRTAGSQPWGAGSVPVTADGQTVEGWLDKSAQTNHLNQSGANSEPTYKTAIQNGLSVIRSIDAAADDYLFSTASILSQDQNVSMFCVAAATGNETLGAVYSNTNTSRDRITLHVDSRSAIKEGVIVEDTLVEVHAKIPSDIGTEFNQISGIIDGLDAVARLNGVAGTVAVAPGVMTTANDYTRVFNQFSSNTDFFGDIGELVIYDRTLNNGEINKVEKYLKDKWATP